MAINPLRNEPPIIYSPTPTSHGAFISVHNLSYVIEKRCILDNITFSIGNSLPFGIFGHRQSGKTSLLQLLLGIVVPSHGDGHVLGYDIRTQSSEIRRIVGYAAGGWGIPLQLNLHSFLSELLSFREIGQDKADSLIDDVLYFLSLSKYRLQPLGQVPAQAQAKAILAQALVHKPKLLILDDMTVFLDPLARREAYEIVKALLQIEGLSLIIASSDAEFFLDFAETGAFISHGKLLGTGNLQSLASHYAASTLHELYCALARDADGTKR
jgi:ABC-2 type transport system ATP-binding protein